MIVCKPPGQPDNLRCVVLFQTALSLKKIYIIMPYGLTIRFFRSPLPMMAVWGPCGILLVFLRGFFHFFMIEVIDHNRRLSEK